MNDQQRVEVDRAIQAVLADSGSSRFSIQGTIKPEKHGERVRAELVEFVGKVLDRMERTEPRAMRIADVEYVLPIGPIGRCVRDTLNERLRQISVEGFTPEHDTQHQPGALAQAAAVYAMPPDRRVMWGDGRPIQWPFEEGAYKPSDDRRRDLVRAGALILAELERYDAGGTR